MVHGGKANKSGLPYLFGSATSGLLEIGLFHPVDTITKRLMSNTGSIYMNGQLCTDTLGKIIFRENVQAKSFTKLVGLFPGVRFGAAYKVLQRTYKWGGQPLLKGALDRRYGKEFRGTFGNSNGQDLMNACAGSLVGAGEVLLLPLDVLKIKAQVNPDVLHGRALFCIVRKERLKLYRGWHTTIARNMPGSFALFGANSMVYTRVFDIEGPRAATLPQIFMASLIGGCCSIAVSSPMDVIKTRIQHRCFSDKRGAICLANELVREEGFSAFFKGLTPKICLVGPKLVFGFTVAQWLIARIDVAMHGKL